MQSETCWKIVVFFIKIFTRFLPICTFLFIAYSLDVAISKQGEWVTIYWSNYSSTKQEKID